MTGFFKSDFSTSIGTLYYLWGVEGTNKEVNVIFLGNDEKSFKQYIDKLDVMFSGTEFYEKKCLELEEKILNYLSGKNSSIDLKPLFLMGSDFEKKIWQEAMNIPYGSTVSYRELAQRAGFLKAWRAAGTALNHNPVMLIVPCHRVIRSNGKIGFFGGGVEVKEFLIRLENN
ncbi:MAG: methylated-DNA--[protein]-cysteine S-methyltransferase [Actinobacteria bacterium]|nr:methylated-DNA--[protein]-cysteine S-methyltransferase [Actinomycetota bacterium]